MNVKDQFDLQHFFQIFFRYHDNIVIVNYFGHDKHIENMKIYQNLYCVNPSRINHLQHIGVAVSQNKSALMYCDV